MEDKTKIYDQEQDNSQSQGSKKPLANKKVAAVAAAAAIGTAAFGAVGLSDGEKTKYPYADPSGLNIEPAPPVTPETENTQPEISVEPAPPAPVEPAPTVEQPVAAPEPQVNTGGVAAPEVSAPETPPAGYDSGSGGVAAPPTA